MRLEIPFRCIYICRPVCFILLYLQIGEGRKGKTWDEMKHTPSDSLFHSIMI